MPLLKITMVGTSGTGKTCYLYGTYSRLLDGVGNFNFCASDYIQGLDLQNGWDTFVLEGVWPQGTANKSTMFKFDVLLQGRKIADFNWLDYRGGILTERTDTPDALNSFMNYLKDSNGVLVCISADLLKLACLTPPEELKTQEGLKNRTRALSVFANYQLLLNQVVQRSIPVVLTITKGDIIKTKEEYRTVLQFLKKKFQVLFQTNSPAVMIARVRLGKFGPNQVQGGMVDGVVEPVNLHVPILFPIWMALDTQIQALNSRISDQNDDLYTNSDQIIEANQKGFWSRLWNGDPRPELKVQRESIKDMLSSLEGI